MNRLGPAVLRIPRALWGLTCLAAIAVIATGDFLTGYELSLSILYLLPIYIAAWFIGRDAGLGISMIAAAAWLVSTAFTAHVYSHPFYYFWDTAIRFLTFAIFALIISRLKVALMHADERFVTVLEGMDAAVFVTDEAGSLLYRNERFRKIAGAETLLSASAAVSPASRGTGGEAVESFDAGGGRWYLLQGRSIRWVDGRTVRLHLATDITERKQSEELARQQQERLQMTARLISVGELASTLAHELNQPLAAISNYTQGIIRRLRGGAWNLDEIVTALEKSGQQADRAGRIIQRARDLVRRREPSFGPCDLNAVVTRVVALIAPAAEQRGVEVRTELDARLPAARADEVMIEQVILNLATNAIEAMSGAGSPSPRLTLRSWLQAGDGAQISLIDNGPGMDPAFVKAPFTPFFTTKPGGTGLGLNICRSIVEAHGGHLRFEPNAPTGCIFHFSVPLAAE